MIIRSDGEDPILRWPLRALVREYGRTITYYGKYLLPYIVWAVFLLLFSVGMAIALSDTASGEQDVVMRTTEVQGLAMTWNPEYLREDASRIIFEEVEEIHKEQQLSLSEETKQQNQMKEDLGVLLSGYPMEDMISYIVKEDPIVAAFLVGIAKKESDWGKHVPLDALGGDCYNYWGYRASGSLGMQSSGYGCFASPKEAIDVVGGRIYELALGHKRDTPSKMIVWKCGSSCEGHSQTSVSKWISDVDIYYTRVLAMMDMR